MNFAYTLYQAGRARTRDEQIEENRRNGALAAALTRPWRRARQARQARQARGIRVPRQGRVTEMPKGLG